MKIDIPDKSSWRGDGLTPTGAFADQEKEHSVHAWAGRRLEMWSTPMNVIPKLIPWIDSEGKTR